MNWLHEKSISASIRINPPFHAYGHVYVASENQTKMLHEQWYIAEYYHILNIMLVLLVYKLIY